jgi:hypothetical protein
MKTLFAGVLGTVSMLGPRVSLAQDGHMMDGGMWGTGWMGGYGGVWVPVLLVVIVGLVVWIARSKGK